MELLLEERGQLRRRGALGLERGALKAIAHVRTLDRGVNLAREALDDLGRRLAGREHRDPWQDGEIADTRLGHRRYVRRQARAIRSQRGDGAEPSHLDVLERDVYAHR